MTDTQETYQKPAHGWTCFHCGETFTTIGSAGDHFGAKHDAKPGCMIRVQLGDERGLQMALRKAESTIQQERKRMKSLGDLYKHALKLIAEQKATLKELEAEGE